MTTHELMLKVKDELEARGFATTSVHNNYTNQAYAKIEGTCEWRPVEGWQHEHFWGTRIHFDVVHRHNGTEENKSVDIAVFKYEHSSGRRIAKERVNVNMGEKAIQNRINKIVAAFEAC